jgi:hypothetical protein
MSFLLAGLDSSLAQDAPRQQKNLPPRVNGPQLMQQPFVPPQDKFEVTPEIEQAVLDDLAQNNPRALEELREIKAINPKAYTDRLRRFWQEKRHLEMLKKDDPARYEREVKIRDLERQSRELSDNYRKAPDEAARKTIRADLANVLTQLFDWREMNRQDEVKRLETELKRLKETLEQRQKNRAGIIERRILQLTGEAGAMEWE